MNDRPQFGTVETDVDKAKHYREEIGTALGPVLELMNAAKKDGLKVSFNLGENNITWFIAGIDVVRPL